MKRTIPVILILTLAASMMIAPDAGAGWLDKWKKKDKPTESKVAPRYDLFPSMSFHKGILRRGVGLSWQLDGTALEIRKDCRIISDFEDGTGLVEGEKALVMGPKVGDSIVAYNVRIVKPEYMYEGTPSTSEFTPSDSDPAVGEGTGPQ